MIYYTGKAVVLIYHNIDTNKFSHLTITPERFKSDIDTFIEHDFNIISLDKVIKAMNNEYILPPNAIAITFDDGLSGVYEYAVKKLKEYNLPSTCFVITSRIDNYVQSDGLKFLSSYMIKDMYNCYGVDIQSHSHQSHKLNSYSKFMKRGILVSRILNEDNKKESIDEYKSRVNRDLFLSNQKIYECIGKNSNILCFPFGHYNSIVIKIAETVGFKYFITCKQGYNAQSVNKNIVKRINAGISNISTAELINRVINLTDNEFVGKVKNKSSSVLLKLHL